jgi:hypothetical protein
VLYTFGFDRICVVVADLYFVDPDPTPGQEGAERGVRVEVRELERGDLRGGGYSAQPIAVGRPIWRGDLLESVDGPPGSFDRTHHHPRFDGWEPCPRVFVKPLSADPLGWVGERLADLDALLADAGVDPAEATDADREGMRRAVPEIVAAVGRLLEGVHAGELGQAPAGGDLVSARAGWL